MAILEKTKKAADNVKKWTAAEYNYLKEFELDLGKIKGHMNDLNIHKKLRTAKAALTMVGRAESKLDRYFKKLDKDVKELAGKLPENLREEELHIENEIQVAARSILEKGSRYVGIIKEKLNSLEVDFELLKKFKNKPKEREIIQRMNTTIDDLIGEIETILTWIRGLVAAIKEETTFLDRLGT